MDARAQARAAHRAGRAAMWGPAPLRVHEQLVTEAAAIAGRDPALATAMLVDAAQAAIAGGDPLRAVATSRRARALARRAGGRTARLAEVQYAVAVLAAGGKRPAGRGALAAIDRLAARDPADTLEALLRGAIALYWTEDHLAAGRLLERVVDRARSIGSPLLANALDTLAAVLYRTGDWPAADALSAEALRIARERGVTFDTASAATTLARIAAVRGDETTCRELLSDARALAPPGSLAAAYAASAAGLLELSLGRADDAVRELGQLGATGAGTMSPLINQWLPELIEALVRDGRPSEAAVALASLEESARAGRGSLVRALAARCRGLLVSGPAAGQDFEEALRLHRQVNVPFERARTELCYGEHLRRGRRRADAVVRLRSALATFERLGAAPWAERARRELAPLQRRAGPPAELDALTTHERAVATLIGRGATNREAAAALFVTPKTIEYHLAGIYRKMGVRSRTELVIALFKGEQGTA